MKRLAIAIVMMLLAISASAQVTALIGQSRFNPQMDGIWYQQGAGPYVLKLSSPAVGVRYDTAKQGNWSYGIGYQNLGRVTSVAEAVATEFAPGGYDPGIHSCIGPCMPKSHWYGKGNVQGVFASALWHHGDYALEAGAYIYKPEWQMHIPDWLRCATCAPEDVTKVHSSVWQVGPMFGLRYKANERVSLAITAWYTEAKGDDWIAIYRPWTVNASVGYSF